MKFKYFLMAVFAGLCVSSMSVLQAATPPATPPAAAKWVCAGSFERKLGHQVASVNIQKYRERFLAAKRGAVQRAVFVFPASYETMRKHLQSVSKKRFGERELIELTDLNVLGVSLGEGSGRKSAQAHRRTTVITPEQTKRVLAGLEAAGIGPGPTSGTRIRTNKYNIVPSKEGWSELEILVVDGKDILGADSTLVFMSRRDSAKQWGMAKSGNPFSFGHNRVQSAFVTSTEFKLMQRLGKLYKIPFEVFPLDNRAPVFGNAKSWRAAKDWLQAYENEPETAAGAKEPGRC